jgi:hypothetical protein
MTLIRNVQIIEREYFQLAVFRTSCNVAFGNFHGHQTFQSEMNDDHVYRDAQYSWDDYSEA